MTYQQIRSQHFKTYSKKYHNFFENFVLPEKKSEVDIENLQTASAVFSSNIEGNTLDLNSFQNAKNFGKNFPQKKEEEEIEDLIQAYIFTEKNILTEENFLQTHKISSQTLLPNSQQGKYRDQKVGVFGKEGLVYMAVEEEKVEEEMKILFEEISVFCRGSALCLPNIQKGQPQGIAPTVIQISEIFFFASYIHLRFVHIHPFVDGNGRMARLLEKWIGATLVGKNFWHLQTEEMYKNNREKYYKNINIGVNFYELDYGKSFSFLEMLPKYL